MLVELGELMLPAEEDPVVERVESVDELPEELWA
jgi:hypothetical protein